MSDLAIGVEALAKRYRIGRRESYRTLRDTLTDVMAAPFRAVGAALNRGRAQEGEAGPEGFIWALKDVSFAVKWGEVMGVIGANGAGKSTLLKILARITEPTEGCVEIRGRVGSLLEVGTGFHPELTGRENIYFNGAVLGMRRAEIARRFDEIAAFAGVEKFLDTPVKHYSSGMYTRLAFAVAAHLQTEILLVDEVLAVGDVAFQMKCVTRMSEVSRSGKTILFVSHNMEVIKQLCQWSILLDRGAISYMGPARECVERYLLGVRSKKGPEEGVLSLREHPGRTKVLLGAVRLTGLTVLGLDGRPGWVARCGELLQIVLTYELMEGAGPQNVVFGIAFSNLLNHPISTCVSSHTHAEDMRIEKSGRVVCRVPRLPLVPGVYPLTVGCSTESGPSDGVYDAVQIEVIGDSFYPSRRLINPKAGDVLFDHEWELLEGETTRAEPEPSMNP